jgi:hypothetical protein
VVVAVVAHATTTHATATHATACGHRHQEQQQAHAEHAAWPSAHIAWARMATRWPLVSDVTLWFTIPTNATRQPHEGTRAFRAPFLTE